MSTMWQGPGTWDLFRHLRTLLLLLISSLAESPGSSKLYGRSHAFQRVPNSLLITQQYPWKVKEWLKGGNKNEGSMKLPLWSHLFFDNWIYSDKATWMPRGSLFTQSPRGGQLEEKPAFSAYRWSQSRIWSIIMFEKSGHKRLGGSSFS